MKIMDELISWLIELIYLCYTTYQIQTICCCGILWILGCAFVYLLFHGGAKLPSPHD